MRAFDLPIEFLETAEYQPTPSAKGFEPSELKSLARLLDWGGWPSPIVCDDDGRVVRGAARIEAAKLFGWSTLPVVRSDQLHKGDLEAFEAADRRLLERAKWDALLSPTKGAAAAQSTSNPTLVQKGDHWRLGRHHLRCGDVRDARMIEGFIESDVADFVYMDPPHNLGGGMPQETYVGGIVKAMLAAHSAVRPGGLVAACLEWRRLGLHLPMAERLGLGFRDFWVWTGAENGPEGALYSAGCKVVTVFRSGGGAHINNVGIDAPPHANVFADQPDADFPTTPPATLLAKWIEDATPRNGVVVDLFAGAGSALFGAERAGRTARLVELQPKRCDALLRRFLAETGEVPTLDGVTMDEVAEKRTT